MCIGNNNYDILSKLKYAVNDAIAVGEELRKLGYETVVESDLNRAELIRVIFEFAEKMEACESAILFYAGHGFQVEGDNIFAPIDLNINTNNGEIKLNSFPLVDLMKEFEKYPQIPKAIIIDACRNIVNNRGGESNFAPVTAPQGTIIAFATSPGQTSKENDEKKHGLYTNELIKHMSIPRVTIESVFKKVRESLCVITNGEQIPWEHTSLIGDFYLNPNTIYDGFQYSIDALADKDYNMFSNIDVKNIVSKLKKKDWYKQRSAISEISKLKYEEISANDLFVLGRNIYQAADGGCFDAQDFIDKFDDNRKILFEAKLHILNGMAYEIYFTSNNILRIKLKFGYGDKIVCLLEKENYYESRNFIGNCLEKEKSRLLYIPGQKEIMEINIFVRNDDYADVIDFFAYKGRKLYNTSDGDEGLCASESSTKKDVAIALGAPEDCVKLIWNNRRQNIQLTKDYYYLALSYEEI